MSHTYWDSPDDYRGIAWCEDPRISEAWGFRKRDSAEAYSMVTRTMIQGGTHWFNDDKEPQAYILLDQPFTLDKSGKLNSSRTTNSSIIELTFFEQVMVLFEGAPVIESGFHILHHLRKKHERLLDKISDKQDDDTFWRLLDGHTEAYDKDPHKARWGLLRKIVPFVNFDVKLAEELFQASALWTPSWEVEQSDSSRMIDVVIGKLLEDRWIHHKNEIEGFIMFHYPLRFNEVTGRPEIKESKKGIPIDDFQFNSIHRHIENKGGRITSSRLKQQITSDLVPKYHPFRVYFDGLHAYDPDKEADYIEQFAGLIPTADKDYLNWTLQKWIVGCVATGVSPTETNQQVFVLSGGQGLGKSTVLEGLVPPALNPEYLYSGPIDPGNKDSLAMLSGKFIINLDELDSITAKKEAELKNLITLNEVTYRRPYGTFPDTYKRHASFMASVNHEGILSDMTGSRRFLIHKVTGPITYNHAVPIDRLWAQAYHLYQTGFQYWFNNAKDQDRIEKHNSAFESRTAEEELLLDYFEPTTNSAHKEIRLTATQITKEMFDGQYPSGLRSSRIKVGQALKKHDFDCVEVSRQKYWKVRRTKQNPNK